jgi:hypothetical protein
VRGSLLEELRTRLVAPWQVLNLGIQGSRYQIRTPQIEIQGRSKEGVDPDPGCGRAHLYEIPRLVLTSLFNFFLKIMQLDVWITDPHGATGQKGPRAATFSVGLQGYKGKVFPALNQVPRHEDVSSS